MPSKIKEIIIEPSRIEVGSIFKIKIKAVRGANYNELKGLTYQNVDAYKYSKLKGD